MNYSIILSISNNKKNISFCGSSFFFNNSMTKVNITSDLSMLYFLLPSVLLVFIINAMVVILFKSLDTNFVYKMIIYDSINNVLFAIVGSYGNAFKHPFPFGPFCSLHVALNYGLGIFNRLVPLAIVLHRLISTFS